jgi:hypothetical protein
MDILDNGKLSSAGQWEKQLLDKSKFDGFLKSPEIANFLISHLIISMGYEIKIREL